jgi:hypothetical protein
MMGSSTAQHFAIGDKITTKNGKTGVVTHIHAKAGYLFIKNQETGHVYHVSWASVTNVNSKSAAQVAGKGQSATENYWQSPAGKPILEAANKQQSKPAANGGSTPEPEAGASRRRRPKPLSVSVPSTARSKDARQLAETRGRESALRECDRPRGLRAGRQHGAARPGA